MADYPATYYNPRVKKNWPDVVFDSNKKAIIFKEDFDSLENEIKAIEQELGLYVSGSYNTLKERVEDIESKIEGITKGMKLTMSTTQTITHNSTETIEFDTANDDTLGGFDSENNKWVCQEPGTYRIYLQTWANDGDDLASYISIRKNITDVANGRRRGTGIGNIINVSARLVLVENDEITFRQYYYNYTDGGNVVLDNTASRTFAFIEKVA